MFCRNCGNTISDTAKFCRKCGCPVAATPPSPSFEPSRNTATPEPVPEPVPEKKSFNLLKILLPILGLSILLVVAVIILPIGTIFGSGSEDSSNEGSMLQSNYIDTEQGTPFSQEELDNILLADISDEDWEIFSTDNEILCEIVDLYSNEDGYIEGDTDEVLNAVAAQLDAFYEKGDVIWYKVDGDMNTISFQYAFGLTGYYAPAQEGVLSGGGGNENISIRTYGIVDSMDSIPYSSVTIGNILANGINGICDYTTATLKSYQDEAVGFYGFLDASDSNIFVYLGHGGYTEAYGSFLLTGLEYDPATQDSFFKQSVFYTDDEGNSGNQWLYVGSVTTTIGKWWNAKEVTTTYWSVTSRYFEDVLSMDQGLAFLFACYSGMDNRLADAFISSGAETVFYVVDGSVLSWYASSMLYHITRYMSGTADGIFHTASEALSYASSDVEVEAFSASGNGMSLEAWMNEAECTGRIALYGDNSTDYENYTLVSGIRCSLTYDEDISGEDFYGEILSQLTISVCPADGSSADAITFQAEENMMFFNELEPGTYTVALYMDGYSDAIDQSDVTVESHRFAAVTLNYSAMEIDYRTLYAPIVAQYEETYGTVSFYEDNYSSDYTHYSGVFFLELLDFDQNGFDELIIGYAVDPGIEDVDDGTWAYFDVWQICDMEPVIAYEKAFFYMGDLCKCCLYTQLDDTCYLVTGVEGEEYYNLSLLGLRDGEFVTVSTLEGYLGTQNFSWYVDGVEMGYDELSDYYVRVMWGCPCPWNRSYFSGEIGPSDTYTADDLTEQLASIKSVIGLE